MIDNSGPGVIRSRHGQAVASYYKRSKRIIVVADSACFHHGEVVLRELSKHVADLNRKGTNS